MKTFYLFFCFIFVSNNLQAQAEFPMQNASWCYSAMGEMNNELYSICFSTDSLLEISGKTYARIRYKKDVFDDTLNTIYYREEAKKFYVLPKDSINEILLCDFNLEVGDHFTFPKWGSYGYSAYEATVHSVSSITTEDAVIRKVISLSDSTGVYNAFWLEGFGNLFWIFLYPNYIGNLDNYFTFLCHTINDKIVYSLTGGNTCNSLMGTKDEKSHKSISLFPNPTDGIISFSEIDNFKLIKIYNVWGQENSYKMTNQEIDISHLKAGIYIVVITDQNNNQYFSKIVKL